MIKQTFNLFNWINWKKIHNIFIINKNFINQVDHQVRTLVKIPFYINLNLLPFMSLVDD